MNVYEIIANAILEKLEQGSIPWHKPWNGKESMPKNLITKKEYQGINAFLLGCQGYSSPYWLTFRQCRELGGSVKKGAKATPVIYWNWLDIEKDGETEEKIPFLRYYAVFNVEQCEGIPEDKVPQAAIIGRRISNAIVRVKKGVDRIAEYIPAREAEKRPSSRSRLIIHPSARPEYRDGRWPRCS